MSAHDQERMGEGAAISETVRTVARIMHERARYILENLDTIPVRVRINGRWRDKYLAQLPVPLAISSAFSLLMRADTPRAKREGET